MFNRSRSLVSKSNAGTFAVFMNFSFVHPQHNYHLMPSSVSAKGLRSRSRPEDTSDPNEKYINFYVINDNHRRYMRSGVVIIKFPRCMDQRQSGRLRVFRKSVFCLSRLNHVVRCHLPDWASNLYERFALYLSVLPNRSCPHELVSHCTFHLTFYVSKSFSPVLSIFCFHSLSDRITCGVKSKRALAQP
jgi:hypothetical protein